MPKPSAYLDECVNHVLVAALRKRGFVVSAARDEHMTQLDDESQLGYASAHGWLIVTHNRRHFRRLHLRWGDQGLPHAGIAVIPVGLSPAILETRTAMMLDWIATFATFDSQLASWGQLQQLLGAGYRLPGYTEDEVRLALGREQ